MKQIGLVVILLCLLSGSVRAQSGVDVFYSTSSTDSAAGSSLELGLGETGSIFVWVTNGDLGPIEGLGLNFLSSVSAILQATGFNIEDPVGRWTGFPLTGDLGDLVTGSNVISLGLLAGDTGILPNETLLHGEITFQATAAGLTDLSIQEGRGVIAVDGAAPSSLRFGSATVTVSAVPEPGSALIGVLGVSALLLRRRR